MSEKRSVDRRDFLKTAAAAERGMYGLVFLGAVCAIGVVGIGVYPAPWVTMAQRVASTLFP